MLISIIPKPLKIKVIDDKNSFAINNSITLDIEQDNIKNNLNDYLFKAFGYKLKDLKGGEITTLIDSKLIKELGDEGYKLNIDVKGIKITAPTENGLFYGVQSLKQIITQFMTTELANLPLIVIEDKPKYAYRGYMLDVCRHFFAIQDVYKVIDSISLHKINKLHLHLTEDQGWRIEIDKYPRLTTVGARRKDTIGDGRWHGGFLTKQDVKDIVSYCKDRYIDVIPEINMPGHSKAALASYNYLSCTGKPIEVATTFGIKFDIFCAGKESTYEFLYNVMDEIVEMFPYEYIHLGGDEAPKDRWNECPECLKMLKDNNMNRMEELQGFFMNKVVDYLKKKGKKAICWNESIYSGNLDKSVVCQYWSDGKKPIRVINEINSGRAAIISKFKPYYLDYPCAMHSLKAAYEFNPKLEGVENESNIMGIEAPLWTEYVKDLSKVENMSFPRLAAICETAWTNGEDKDYDDFYCRIPNFLKLLDIYSVRYNNLSETNPGLRKKFKQMKDFLKLIATKKSIESLKESNAAVKSIKKAREEVK